MATVPSNRVIQRVRCYIMVISGQKGNKFVTYKKFIAGHDVVVSKAMIPFLIAISLSLEQVNEFPRS